MDAESVSLALNATVPSQGSDMDEVVGTHSVNNRLGVSSALAQFARDRPPDTSVIGGGGAGSRSIHGSTGMRASGLLRRLSSSLNRAT